MIIRHEVPGRFTRLVLLVIGLALAGIFVVAALLNPDSRGFGTHEQLGFPPCQFKSLTGLNCPHCGMTTAFSHFVRGQWSDMWRSNPSAMILAPLFVLTSVWCFTVSGTGRWWLTAEPTWWLIFGGIAYLAATVVLWVIRLL
ncbi:MAG: DUF2752 domain-containing protein [Planctomycetaceae bacterium]